jgi:hypothetical protein
VKLKKNTRYDVSLESLTVTDFQWGIYKNSWFHFLVAKTTCTYLKKIKTGKREKMLPNVYKTVKLETKSYGKVPRKNSSNKTNKTKRQKNNYLS